SFTGVTSHWLAWMDLSQAWSLFQQGVGSSLRQWTALTLAMENNWGGGSSQAKAERLLAELLEMFKVKKQLYRDEVEDYLLLFLDQQFHTIAEDGSPAEVAQKLLDMFQQCGKFDFTLVNSTLEQEKKLRASGVRSKSVAGKGEDYSGSEDDDDGSDSDGDDAMGVIPEGKAVPAVAKPGPDSDGWETVRRR
ncbi:unnamed protein product, partial [Chrysoparadoxa australica]